MIKLKPHQLEALNQMTNGCILKGGVGTGKSLTALAYYTKVCGGRPPGAKGGYKKMSSPIPLYIISIAKKRNNGEWLEECNNLRVYDNIVIDSWQNIQKYKETKNAFFIFDEQKLIGSGVWVKSFLKIAKNNKWILLSATPGDTWMDYIPVFIANGFYKNRTEFITRHVVYSWRTKFPVVERYLEVAHLIRLRDQITVNMVYIRHTIQHSKYVNCKFDTVKFNTVLNKRWNIFEERPIKDASELCFTLRKIVNTDPDRLYQLSEIIYNHHKIIIFYNFNYELEILKKFLSEIEMPYTEYNGQKHEEPLTGNEWAYLVQYNAGAEAWNCTTTDTIVFYSQNYSYRIKHQSEGRIDRLNTPFTDLYYYHLRSLSRIDLAISVALETKKDFNENRFMYV